MIEVCLLGCGGMMPLPDRRLTALLVRCNGRMILVDCGEGTQIGVKLAGWGFKAIDTILLTHFHGDHVAGLPGLLMTIGNSGRVEPLTIVGPKFLLEIVKGLCVIVPELPFEVRIVELQDMQLDVMKFGDLDVNAQWLDHSMPCLAYSFELKRPGRFDVEKAKEKNIPMEYWNKLQRGENVVYGNKTITPSMVLGEPRKGIKLVYFTDTRPVPELKEFSVNSNLMICEGIYAQNDMLEKAITKKHMIFSEAAQLCKSSNSAELWLTHFSPSLKNPQEFINYATDIFPNTVVGKDIMFKSLKFMD